MAELRLKKLMLAVVAALAAVVLLTGCDDAPATPTPEPEPEAHPIVGSWTVTVWSALDRDGKPMESTPAGWEGELDFGADGAWEFRSRHADEDSWGRILGSYTIDEDEKLIVVSQTHAVGSGGSAFIDDRTMLMRYEIDGNRATLRSRYAGSSITLVWTLERGTLTS